MDAFLSRSFFSGLFTPSLLGLVVRHSSLPSVGVSSQAGEFLIFALLLSLLERIFHGGGGSVELFKMVVA